MNSIASGASTRRRAATVPTVAHVLEHFDDTTRSNLSAMSNSLMSAGDDFEMVKPRTFACSSMCSFWVREFETPVMRLFGNRSAMNSDSDPQPQPSSSTRCPSSSRARLAVRSSCTARRFQRVDARA